MTNKGNSFWCAKWHQQVYERLCMHRYMKGLKKCEGCGKGKELIEEEMKVLKQEAGRLGGQEA